MNLNYFKQSGTGGAIVDGSWKSRLRTLDPCIVLALFALWVFCNPYFATDRGSLIYAGRALADMDPAGIGQDIMFRYDGQSGFTLFTPIFDWIAASLGISAATYLIAAAAVVFSFLGAVCLASGIAKGRTAYIVIAFAAALPAYYGGYKLFSYAETAATPRPFAETFVLCGLTALLFQRQRVSIALMACAMIFHPIMGLAGVAIWLFWMIVTYRKWALMSLAAFAAVIAVTLITPSLFEKVFAVVDTEWRSVLIDRNPHLFPSLWVTGWIGRTVTRTATLLIAASLVSAPVRKLFLIVLAVGYGGLAVSYVLGEKFSMLLVLEAQTWRMMWLIFAIGAAAAAICVVELWQRDGLARMVLALLAWAWAWADYDGPAVLLAVTAVIMHFGVDPKDHPLRRDIQWVMQACMAALLAVGLARTLVSVPDIIAAAPPTLAGETRRTLSLPYDYTPLAALAVFAIIGLQHVNRMIVWVVALMISVPTLAYWDQRSQANKGFDEESVPDLQKIVASRPGEIYWINGLRENWWWLQRPNWVASIQGAGIIFSRDLALLYKQRTQRALDQKLADENLLTPFAQPLTDLVPNITLQNVNAFCAFSDAPAWIVAPLRNDWSFDAKIPFVEWTAPVPQLIVSSRNGIYHWQAISRYAVINCSQQSVPPSKDVFEGEGWRLKADSFSDLDERDKEKPPAL